ncbi:MAG TPA: hypothetical protein VKR54_04945 [Candidatus Babeliales bacterium]|nr:hypothetical protein [Candidatus Babeliales bacterium]
MADAMRYIRFFVVVLFCSNFSLMVAGDRSFDPYSSYLRAGSLGGKGFLRNGIFAEMMKHKIVSGASQAYSVTSKIIVQNPKETLAIATLVALLGLAWSKRESIKQWYDSKAMLQYKEYMVSFRDSAVVVMDNQIARIPFPFSPIVVGLRGLISFLYHKLVAMEGEYVAGVILSPVVGYLNSYTPFAALGGTKMGLIASVACLVRGWMGIDAATINKSVKNVEHRVETLQQSVTDGQQAATKNHEQMLTEIQGLEEKINQASLEIKQEIETSHNQTAKLTEKIADLSDQVCALGEQVSILPSKDDIGKALAQTVENFRELVVSSVEQLDQRTEKKLVAIEERLTEGLQKIDSKQEEVMLELEKNFGAIIDEREANIRVITTLVDSTKLSNSVLLEKFDYLDSSFKNIQLAYHQSDEKYQQLLNQKTKDWQRLEEVITKQINGFDAIYNKLSLELQNKIDVMDKKVEAVEQKTDVHYVSLNNKMDVVMQEQKAVLQHLTELREKTRQDALMFKEELLKINEESAKKMDEQLKNYAAGFQKGQSKILDAINQKNQTQQITLGEPCYQLSYSQPFQIKSSQANQNNGFPGRMCIKNESYS